MAYNVSGTLINSANVSVSGEVSAMSNQASVKTIILGACDIDEAGAYTVGDVQSMLSQALGFAAPANDLSRDGSVSLVASVHHPCRAAGRLSAELKVRRTLEIGHLKVGAGSGGACF